MSGAEGGPAGTLCSFNCALVRAGACPGEGEEQERLNSVQERKNNRMMVVVFRIADVSLWPILY